MPIIIRAEMRGNRIDDLTVREQRIVEREAMVATATEWSGKYLPRHFRSGAAGRYGYAKRRPRYLRRKRRLGDAGIIPRGGRSDLVFTGQMEREIMASRNNIRGFPSRATITMKGPAYFRIRPKKPSHPNMANEVNAIAPAERVKLVAVAATQYTKSYRASVARNPRKRYTKGTRRK
jgi:hypothetical protein